MALWDEYQQMLQGGWSPPPGIEGVPGGGWSTSGNKAWQDAHNPQPIPQPSSQGGNMPVYGQNYDDIRRRNQGYFPNVNPAAGNQQFPLAPGVAEGQARIRQLQSQGRQNYTTYQLPSGGTAQLPAGARLPSGYSGVTPYVPPRNAAQQFDLNQAYAQGYGAPTPTIQQGAGGLYRVAGGVAAPVQNNVFPNLFNSPAVNAYWNFGARNLAAVGNLASNVFSNVSRAATRAFNPTSYTQTSQSPFYPSMPTYAGGFSNRGPRRYFDY